MQVAFLYGDTGFDSLLKIFRVRLQDMNDPSWLQLK